jgi:arginyl-tRNA--protein-N-Asp/Glu arginylyltransferase
MADWNKNVAPFLSEKYSSMYSEYQEDFSTVALGDYSDKIAINHIFPKPGCTDKVEELLKKIKKAWTAGNQTVAVYTSSSSGPTQYSLVTRYKQGLKERDKNFRKPFKERFEATNGEGSYENYLESVSRYTDHSWSELLFLRPELSSK